MEKIYIEFLSELETHLDEIENSCWHSWMKKSIDKYNENQDVSYFLSAFGGCGSYNDEYKKSETTQILTNIVYSMAIQIQKQGYFDLTTILQNEQIIQKKSLDSFKEYANSFQNERYIEECIKRLNYINYIVDNYSVGNLNKITSEYFKQKINDGVKRK